MTWLPSEIEGEITVPDPAFLRRLPIHLGGIGLVVIGLGAVLQATGIALPSSLGETVGAQSSFGIAAKLGGSLALAGTVLGGLLLLWADLRADRNANARREDTVAPFDDLPASITPQRMAEWQKRLAERVNPEEGRPRTEGILARLHRLLLMLVGVAITGLIAMILWGFLSNGL